MIGAAAPLATVHGLGEAAEKAGVILVALLAATAVLGRAPRVSERARALAMLAALVLTPVLLLADVWQVPQLRHLRAHPGLAAAVIVAGVVIVAGLALLFHRRPQALAIAAVLTVPFRLPISTGGTSSNLLIPLYLVIGAGSLAYMIPRLRGRERPPLQGRRGALFELPLMAGVVLYAIQASYSVGFTTALENTVFFYVPFALLFVLLRDLPWSRRLLVGCLGVAVGLALILSGVGFAEYARKQLFLNPRVVAANRFSGYFRVNSLFFDPNIYGRFLILVMIGVVTVILARAPGQAPDARRRLVLGGAVVLAWLWCGLVTSFSQSSIAALLLGLAILAAWRWQVRATLYVAAAVVAAGVIFLLVAPASLHLGLKGSGGSANNATNGRARLITGGLSLFGDRPLQGYGSGSFAREYAAHHETTSILATTDSHTTPVTVLAEQGIVGFALYVALLVTSLLALFRGAGRSPPRILVAACFAALVLHTWAYADFLEDPITWLLLGVGAALASLREPERARSPGQVAEPAIAAE